MEKNDLEIFPDFCHNPEIEIRQTSFAILLIRFSLLNKIAVEGMENWSILEGIAPPKLPIRLSTIPFSNQYLPDICLICHKDFGDTIGGRLRNGCHECQGFGSKKYQVVGIFTLYTGMHPAVAEVFLAKIIRKYL